MLNKLRFSVALLVLLLTVTTEVAAAQSVLRFRPPNRGTPTMTRGGGSRGPEQLKQLRAIAPPGNFGLTTAARPTLLVYIPKTTAKILKVGLKSPDGKRTLYKKEFAVPATPSLVRLDLTEAQTEPLVTNQEYRWYVALFNNAIDRSTGTIVEGRIEPVQPDEKLKQKLKTAKSEQLPAIYADSSLWWDTVLTLDDLRQKQPQNAVFKRQWKTLLESVGLNAIAALPNLNSSQLLSEKP